MRTTAWGFLARLTLLAAASLSFPSLAAGNEADADPPVAAEARHDAGEPGPMRTFEILAHRVSVRTSDDAPLLLDWSPDRYFEEMRAQDARAEPEATRLIEWVAPYDGLVWGRSDANLAAQWDGERRASDQTWWTFFRNPQRHQPGFRFPADSRLMGMVENFVWHGWPRTVLAVYGPQHKEEFPHIWVGLTLAQQVFLACADPEEALRRYATFGWDGETREHEETLPDGRVRRQLTFTPVGIPVEVILRIESAGADPEQQPATWRFVHKNLPAGESLLFVAEWRETTATSERWLPTLPKETRAVHADVERSDRVGAEDWTGLGLWDDKLVEYKVAPRRSAVSNGFSSPAGRWLTNAGVFVALLSVLRRERIFHFRGESS